MYLWGLTQNVEAGCGGHRFVGDRDCTVSPVLQYYVSRVRVSCLSLKIGTYLYQTACLQVQLSLKFIEACCEEKSLWNFAKTSHCDIILKHCINTAQKDLKQNILIFIPGKITKIKFRLIRSMNLNYVCFYVLTFWKHAVIKLSGKRFLEGKINDIIKNKYLKNDNGLDKNGIPLCLYLWLVNKSFTWSCLQTCRLFLCPCEWCQHCQN